MPPVGIDIAAVAAPLAVVFELERGDAIADVMLCDEATYSR